MLKLHFLTRVKLIKNQSDTLTFRLRTFNPDKQLMNNL